MPVFMEFRIAPRLHALWVILPAIAACTSNPEPRAFLSKHVAVSLPRPDSLGHSWHASQIVTVDYGGKTGKIAVELEVSGEWLNLVGLAGFGPPVFTIRFDGRRIFTEQRATGFPLPPPSQVLAGVMLVYWPRSAWVPLLPPGWRLDEDGGNRALIDEKGALVVRMRIVGQVNGVHNVEIVNPALDYRLRIDTYASDRS